MTCKNPPKVRLSAPMASKRRPQTPKRDGDYERQVTIRLPAEQLQQIQEIRRKAGFGTSAQIMREALGIGLRDILRRYER